MNRILLVSLTSLLVTAATAQTPVLRRGVSVQEPVTTNAVPMPDADLADSVVVATTLNGTVFFNVTRVQFPQLSEMVRTALQGHAGKRVYVKTDARAKYSTVAQVLDALRDGGVNTPILLTDQPESTNLPYRLPTGLEVTLLPPTPAEARSINVKAGDRLASDTELKQQVQPGKPVVLLVESDASFDDVAHAVDVCSGVGAKVFLTTPRAVR